MNTEIIERTPKVELISGHQPRILVVDDDPCMCEYTREFLTQSGYRVTVASDGAEALAAIGAHSVDLVLLDIFMPGRDGFETIKEIKEVSPRSRIIAISGRAEYRGINVLSFAKKIGANAGLSKPFTPGELLKVIKTVL